MHRTAKLRKNQLLGLRKLDLRKNTHIRADIILTKSEQDVEQICVDYGVVGAISGLFWSLVRYCALAAKITETVVPVSGELVSESSAP